MSKVQEAGSILRISFTSSNSPHLHRAYPVIVRRWMSMTVSFLEISFWLLHQLPLAAKPIFKGCHTSFFRTSTGPADTMTPNNWYFLYLSWSNSVWSKVWWTICYKVYSKLLPCWCCYCVTSKEIRWFKWSPCRYITPKGSHVLG